MILPIVAYGHPVLRKVCSEIAPEHPDLAKLIDDMWDTMYGSKGVGLAAPQINKGIRLFVVDSAQMFAKNEEDEIDEEEENDEDEFPGEIGIKQVFINAHIVELNGEEWSYNEGCLSIPKIREDIIRQETITLEFEDENFELHTQTYKGITARIILHEYDHIEGKLFIDHISPLKRKLMKRKLDDISKGNINVDYKMLFAKK